MESKALIEKAKSVLGEFSLGCLGSSAGAVGAALVTDKGNVYTGICIVAHCGIGFCAEHAAVAEMLKNRESRISKIVAVSEDGIIPPCGRCRELINQVNSKNVDTDVCLGINTYKKLNELLPDRFV